MILKRLGDLAAQPADPLLSIIGAFRADERPGKIDLGVGVYKDASGATPIMQAIRSAHGRIADLETSKVYLGPKGWPGFAEAAKGLILGEGEAAGLSGRAVATPTPGGCGALRLAGELLRRGRPDAKIWASDPTWANHKPIFAACGFEMVHYPYFDRDNGLLVEPMLAALEGAAPGDVVLLHGCCHNPTGEDLTHEAWSAVSDLIIRKDLLPLVDVAYHGLGDGMDKDLAGMRALIARAPEAIVTYSFSKNMGLYRDRVGAIMFLGQTKEEAAAVDTHILAAARQSWSMPPTYGEALAYLALSEPALRTAWIDELAGMRARVAGLRAGAARALGERFGNDRFGFLTRQKGMFSMLPLSRDDVSALRDRHAIYAAPDGRINICGLPEDAMDRFAAAVADVVGA
ncbi:MAG: aminotransferase class I/II-fold pyridoxal phosphate-dependent enzyme [Alphaproteobacteria bacterium]|nr:aminotransferase class I/II-fold pyridoxal phosphate-dependent enzyme [Alphaproteobacteria bacterium]